MADDKSKSKPVTESKDSDRNPGTADAAATATADTALAEAAGISEGDVKALRDDAGLDQMAGHEGDIHAWAISPAGKAWAEGEKDREKAAKDEAKAYDEQFEKDDLREAEAKYKEAVSKG